MTASADASRRIGARQVLQFIGGFALAGALLGWGLPHFAKTSWPAIWSVIGTVSAWQSLGFVALVVTGLGAYTFTLTGSMPGLSHLRALIVNVCGSSVSNLLPAGGALGMAATFTICRSWGFTRRAVSTSIIVSAVWNTLFRIALPLIAIVLLTLGRAEMPRIMRDAAVAAVASGAAIVAVFIAVLASGRAATTVGRGVDRMLRPLTRRRPRSMSVDALVTDLRARIIDVVRTGWFPMTMGLVGYFAFYYLVFLAIMRTTGVELFHGELFAAFAIGRLLTAVGITPGGVGVTETGTAAALVAWGAAPAEATAGVVLFSIFTHLLEVPLGAIGWLAWSMMPKTPAPDDEPAPSVP